MKRRILIVGGGYAGALCANRLARKTDAAQAEIVLADPRPWFIDRIRLHEHVAGRTRAPRARASMVDRRVELRTCHVTELDLAARRAVLGGGSPEAFDDLILATGSTRPRRCVAGMERAWSCATAEDAAALRAHLDDSPDSRVLVVGGGLTGIELASELAEARPSLRVTIVASETVGALLSEGARARLRLTLDALGVECREHVRVAAIEDGGVVLASGEAIAADTVVWCGGFEAAPLARESGLAVDEIGRAIVDAHLRSTSHDFVRVIGDAAHVPWPRRDGTVTPLRMGCVSAMPMGAYVGSDLAATFIGREERPFSFGYLIQCISVGRRNGIVQHVDSYDVAQPRHLGGRLGAWTKELICRYALGSVGLERYGVPYSWPRGRALPGRPASPMLVSRPM